VLPLLFCLVLCENQKQALEQPSHQAFHSFDEITNSLDKYIISFHGSFPKLQLTRPTRFYYASLHRRQDRLLFAGTIRREAYITGVISRSVSNKGFMYRDGLGRQAARC
jgi:hypothetical protein